MSRISGCLTWAPVRAVSQLRTTFSSTRRRDCGIEFVLYMVEMERFLVVFLNFRKSRKRQAKVLGMNGETRDCHYFGETSEGETERQGVRHQWQRDNQDRHSAHETRHLTSECARSLLVSSCCRHLHPSHTTSRGSRVRVFALISSMHEVSVTLRL